MIAPELVRIADCCEIVAGATPNTNVDSYWGGPIAWATPKDLSDLDGKYLSSTPDTLTEEGYKSCSAKLMPAGSVLFSSRAPIGHVAINSVPMCTNQGFKSFVPDPTRVSADYLYHWLKANKAYLQSLGNGATFKEVSKAVVSEIRIPLPPLTEQRRIAAILDKADALRAKRRVAIAKLDQLLQSVFLDMFGDAVTNPKAWPIIELGTLIIDGPQNGLYKPASDYGSGTPILRIDGFRAGDVIDRLPSKRLRLDQAEIAKYRLRPADLVINRVNSPEHLGKPALIGALSEDVVFESNMMRLSVDQARVSPRYLLKCLLQKNVRDQISKRRKDAVNQSSINQTDVGSLTIPLPPVAIQEKFAAIVDAASRQQVRFEAATQAVGSMLGSMQQATFSGAL